MDQVIKKQIKKLTLNDNVVVDVSPTDVNVNNTLPTGIKIADIAINGSTKSIYAPNHQDISGKLNVEEFSSISSDFAKKDDLQPYAKSTEIPVCTSQLIDNVGYALSADVKKEYAKKTDLPGIAKVGVQGTIELGYPVSQANKNYPVELDNGKAYVHVEWEGGGGGTGVHVDGVTIKKKEDGTEQIYVNAITKDKVLDFGNYLTADTFIPFKLSQLTNDLGFITLNDVNTDNIKLSEDIVFSGNYTLGLKKQTTSTVWTATKGMSLTQLFKELFTGERPDAQPVVIQPTMTLTLKNVSSRVKIGTPITPGYEISFNPGKYTTTLDGNTKTQASNVQVESYSVTFNGQTLTTQSGTFNTFTPTTAGTMTMNATVTYSAGDYAKTYNDVVTTIRIEAGSKTDSKSFEVYEETIKTYFVDIVSNQSELDSITQENIDTKAKEKYTIKPTKMPYNTAPNNGLAVYVRKSENITGIQIGKVKLNKKDQYELTNYICFTAFDISGLEIKKDSDIIYS